MGGIKLLFGAHAVLTAERLADVLDGRDHPCVVHAHGTQHRDDSRKTVFQAHWKSDER